MPPKKDAAAEVADLAGAALSTSQAFCLTGPRMDQCQGEAPVAWAAFDEEDAARKQAGIASEASASPQSDLLVAQKQVGFASGAFASPQADLLVAQKQEGFASGASAFPQADLLVAQKQEGFASGASAFPQADLMSVGRSGQSGPVFQPQAAPMLVLLPVSLPEHLPWS